MRATKLFALFFVLAQEISYSQAIPQIIHYPFNNSQDANALGCISDNLGNIWVSGRDSMLPGYAMYNGTDWINYFRPVNVNVGLINDFDSSNHLWASAYDSIIIFDGSNFQIIAASAIGVPGTIVSLDLDQNDYAWIISQLSYSYYLTKWDGNNSVTYDSTYFGGNILSCKIDQLNNVYAATIGNIFKFDGISWNIIVDSLPDNASNDFVGDIAFDFNNQLFVLGSYGDSIPYYSHAVYQLIDSTLEIYGLLNVPAGIPFDLTFDHADIPWVRAAGYLIKVIAGSPFVVDIDLPCGFMDGLAVDYWGNFWVSGGWYCNGRADQVLINLQSKIYGHVFLDSNGDGIFQSGESPLQNQIIEELPYPLFCQSGDSGKYETFFIDSNIIHTLSIVVPQYWQTTSPASYSVQPISQVTSGYDFGLAPVSIFDDISISLTSTSAPRPGFPNTHIINLQNVGTTTISEELVYTADNNYSIDSIVPSPSLINGNSITWSFSNLLPFEMRTFKVYLQLPSTVLIGTTLISNANVILPSDEDPSNNSDTLVEVVVGSFDPNDKAAETDGLLEADDQIEYIIRFQNTGTASAIFVIVRDTLDIDLDPATIKLEGYSHPMTWSLSGSGYLEFRFDNINLPDSNSNEPASHGFIKYSIKTKPNLPVGSSITNNASIYFDFNLPVVTNQTLNVIGYPDGIVAAEIENKIRIYPNPSTEIVNIHLLTSDQYKIEITDFLGRNVKSFKSTTSLIQTDVSELISGMYMLRVTSSDGKVLIGKLTKE